MRLLIITQKMAKNDPILGFFHRWAEEFSKHFENIIVICLEEGEHDLPENVQVLSLGKEKMNSLSTNYLLLITAKLKYLFTFYYLLFTLRKQYSAVFVHMNQEYVILGWKFWKLWGKKIYLWRNHAKGSLLTRFAVLVSDKVFCTSPQSYTARFKKTILMPVGIDTDFFKPDPSVQKIPNSILFLGRIAPVKKVLEFVEWLKDQNFDSATIAGSALPKDRDYENKVKERVSQYGLDGKVRFVGAVNQEGARELYQTHELYVNLTPAGSMDKTILEAASCGTLVHVENTSLKNLVGKSEANLRKYVEENHSLKLLLVRLFLEVKNV